jgi:hypothetical protein
MDLIALFASKHSGFLSEPFALPCIAGHKINETIQGNQQQRRKTKEENHHVQVNHNPVEEQHGCQEGCGQGGGREGIGGTKREVYVRRLVGNGVWPWLGAGV